VSEREWDVVLYGATGFTGKRAAHYFAKNAPADLKWAIAGRTKSKLEQLRAQLGRDDVGVIVADSSDVSSVEAMVARTRVMLSTAGPFALYGTPVVKACVDYGVHYVDITGETPWVRSLIDSFHDKAAADKTRIVPLCGYDSVPSDLGAWMMADHIRRELKQGTVEVRAAFSMSGGGLNGGTLASATNMSAAREGSQLYDVLLLNPSNRNTEEERRRSVDPLGVDYDEDFGRWMHPFVMGPVNTRVVRRSNALFALEGRPYGSAFRYTERADVSSRAKAYAITGVLGGVGLLLSRRSGRWLANKFGPKPGEGPSEEKIEGGYCRTRFVGVAEDGRKVQGKMEYLGDAGNKATVLMVCECALALALQLNELPDRGGVLPPAVAFEGILLERLRQAGMVWEILDS
jgi:short subunit dehydrogenase-like uncharacterized protein